MQPWAGKGPWDAAEDEEEASPREEEEDQREDPGASPSRPPAWRQKDPKASPVWGEIGEIQVDISGSSVTLTCPAEGASWTHGKKTALGNPLSLTDNLEEGQVAICQAAAGQDKRKIYVKVKACEDCVELGLGLVAAIIVSDLLVTLGVLCTVYFGCKKRTATFRSGSGGAGTHGRPRDQKVDRPPPVPNPDYEPIRKGQREVYAGLGPRAF